MPKTLGAEIVLISAPRKTMLYLKGSRLASQDRGIEGIRHPVAAIGPGGEDMVAATCAADVVPEIGTDVAGRRTPVRCGCTDLQCTTESAATIQRLHPECIY